MIPKNKREATEYYLGLINPRIKNSGVELELNSRYDQWMIDQKIIGTTALKGDALAWGTLTACHIAAKAMCELICLLDRKEESHA